MKYKLTILLLMLFINVKSQEFYNAQMQLSDGEIIEGEFTLPSNRMFDKSIKRKIGISNKSEKVKYTDITKILYSLENGSQYLFEYKYYNTTGDNFESKSDKEHLGRGWLLLEYNSDIIKLYVGALYYKVENSVMVSNTGYGSPFWPYIYYFVQRPDEEHPFNIWHETFGVKDIGREKKYRKITSAYFADMPKVVEKIQDKTYNCHNVLPLIKFYDHIKQRKQ